MKIPAVPLKRPLQLMAALNSLGELMGRLCGAAVCAFHTAKWTVMGSFAKDHPESILQGCVALNISIG